MCKDVHNQWFTLVLIVSICLTVSVFVFSVSTRKILAHGAISSLICQYLRVYLPQRLLDLDVRYFSDHVSYICRNTSKRIRFFTRLRKLISTKIKLHIYKAAFMPYFHDGSLVWHFSKSSDRNKLE